MLSADIELVDLDGRHWANWLALMLPPGLDGNFRMALAFVEDGELVRAIEVGKGVVELDWKGSSKQNIAAMRRALGVGALLVLDTGALPTIFGDFEAELRADDDYVAQCLTIWQSIKRGVAAGLVKLDPPLLELLPAPSATALQRTFDLLIPDGAAMLAYVMEDDGSGVHASLIASKDGGDVVFATTHLGISDVVSERYLARDWRKRYKKVLEVVEQRFDPPAVAVFLDKSVVERVMTGPVDQLSRELASKNVIIDPAPLWLSALLGGAAVAGVATRGAKGMARLMPKGARDMVKGMAKQAQKSARDAGFDPWRVLGFNPIELWLDLRKLLLERT